MPYKDPQKKKLWIAENRARVKKHYEDWLRRHGHLKQRAINRRERLKRCGGGLTRLRQERTRVCRMLKQIGQLKVEKHITTRGRSFYSFFNARARDIKTNNKYNIETFTATDIIKVFERFNWQCFNCSCVERLCVDHHIPMYTGNILTHSNAVLLCNRCNVSKARKLPSKFYTQAQLKQLNSKGVTQVCQ